MHIRRIWLGEGRVPTTTIYRRHRIAVCGRYITAAKADIATPLRHIAKAASIAGPAAHRNGCGRSTTPTRILLRLCRGHGAFDHAGCCPRADGANDVADHIGQDRKDIVAKARAGDQAAHAAARKAADRAADHAVGRTWPVVARRVIYPVGVHSQVAAAVGAERIARRLPVDRAAHDAKRPRYHASGGQTGPVELLLQARRNRKALRRAVDGQAAHDIPDKAAIAQEVADLGFTSRMAWRVIINLLEEYHEKRSNLLAR